ncbi:hypothetical protein BJY04DRAFT_216722 [Aspergillus karnatakaensis]|uniref:uncharacterized protein n=1 Tax=Aspergillus karnatakaensis TaxID=1810916 RepID=UPI003CCD9B0F
MTIQPTDLTFRAQGFPANYLAKDIENLLSEVLDQEECETFPTVFAVGLDPLSPGRDVHTVATLRFKQILRDLPQTVDQLQAGEWNFEVPKHGITISIDTRFLGFTPLNSVKGDEEHKMDIIAISGLSSHPFGSWKARNSQFMWIRDDLARNHKGARVLLLLKDINLIRRPQSGKINYEPRPIVFIAQSLGGIVVRDAVCRAFESREHSHNFLSVYALMLFGVPHQGIKTSHWRPIVANQPNQRLVNNLDPEALYLRDLTKKVERIFSQLPGSRVITIFETMSSKTAKEEEPGDWKLTGDYDILVSRESAQGSYPTTIKHDKEGFNQNHSDLPKFCGPFDKNYWTIQVYLDDIRRQAVSTVQTRFPSLGHLSNPDEYPQQERPISPGSSAQGLPWNDSVVHLQRSYTQDGCLSRPQPPSSNRSSRSGPSAADVPWRPLTDYPHGMGRRTSDLGELCHDDDCQSESPDTAPRSLSDSAAQLPMEIRPLNESIERKRTYQECLQTITADLNFFIQDRQLKTFFQPGDAHVQSVLESAAKLSYKESTGLTARDPLIKLASLALYQPVFYCDNRPPGMNLELMDNQTTIVRRMARLTTMLSQPSADSEGVHLGFSGGTPPLAKHLTGSDLGSRLSNEILQPLVFEAMENDTFTRPLLVFVGIGGGKPDVEYKSFRDTMVECMESLDELEYPSSAVRFILSRFGKDPSALKILQKVQSDQSLRGIVYCETEPLDEILARFEPPGEAFDKWLIDVLFHAISFDPQCDDTAWEGEESGKKSGKKPKGPVSKISKAVTKVWKQYLTTALENMTRDEEDDK